ncbi:MAG: hypothetical protein FWC68_03350 [Oscillospiraceae bacterium]|nr:hypothetical protein [Oscillospiraceae bacterium]
MNYRNYEDYTREANYGHIPNEMHGGHHDHEMHMHHHNHMHHHHHMEELNNMYPEVYRIMYPMIRRVSNHNRHSRVTREALDNMVNEVYDQMEPEEEVRADITYTEENVAKKLNNDVGTNHSADVQEEVRGTRRRNFLLQDFIRVLLVRDLLMPNHSHCHCHHGRCNCRPHHHRPRPPHHRSADPWLEERLCAPQQCEYPGATY